MARAARIALDLALVSLNIVRPTVSKIWDVAKSAITNTSAKPLVCNKVVTQIEISLDKITSTLLFKMRALRDRQLPKEEKYLKEELEKVRRKINASSKALRPTLGHIWQYAKTEVVPPMTLNFFHGSGGKSLENTISKFANGFIAGIPDAEQLRVIKGREAAIKAQQDKTKAAAKRKEEERKRQEKQKKKELEIAAQVKAREENKTEPEKETPKKTTKEAEKREPVRNKKPKKHRRVEKKRSFPKKNHK